MTKFSVKDKVYRSSIFDKYSYVSGTRYVQIEELLAQLKTSNHLGTVSSTELLSGIGISYTLIRTHTYCWESFGLSNSKR